MATTMTYTVTGMTCGHCIRSVTAAVDTIPGVIDVLSEAGYAMADRP